MDSFSVEVWEEQHDVVYSKLTFILFITTTTSYFDVDLVSGHLIQALKTLEARLRLVNGVSWMQFEDNADDIWELRVLICKEFVRTNSNLIIDRLKRRDASLSRIIHVQEWIQRREHESIS